MKEEFENGILYFGDCLDVLQDLPQNSAEIAITSPPYNLTSIPKHIETSNTKDWYSEPGNEKKYRQQQIKMLLSLQFICKSSIFYNHTIRYAWHKRNKYRTKSNIYHPFQWIESFPIWSVIYWIKGNSLKAPNKRFYNQTEHIYQIGKPNKWNNRRNLTNIWNIKPGKDKIHPCVFPYSLVWNCMQTTTDEGDTIIDPYMGSGTTAIVAIQNNRRFIGIEKNRTYFDEACKRIETEERQLKLF